MIFHKYQKCTLAKKSKITISGRKGTGTEYCLAIIPFGGYVKVAGIIDESMDVKYDK